MEENPASEQDGFQRPSPLCECTSVHLSANVIVSIVVYVNVYVCPLHRSSAFLQLSTKCMGPNTTIHTGITTTEEVRFKHGAWERRRREEEESRRSGDDTVCVM